MQKGPRLPLPSVLNPDAVPFIPCGGWESIDGSVTESGREGNVAQPQGETCPCVGSGLGGGAATPRQCVDEVMDNRLQVQVCGRVWWQARAATAAGWLTFLVSRHVAAVPLRSGGRGSVPDDGSRDGGLYVFCPTQPLKFVRGSARWYDSSSTSSTDCTRTRGRCRRGKKPPSSMRAAAREPARDGCKQS
ncbi:unnamed protein product [Prorocentrum cordatum]|uniref:Uncharacterized protein n=1 Tax=Prorocentrum cordatum TaxID=2364126 RepID=A0ABN9R9I4_9DINO|nr:unnamed protein product [Polarella glacialis]